MTVYVIADVKVTNDRWVSCLPGFGTRSGAQARWQISVTQRERDDAGRQASGYDPYRTYGVSIGGSS